MSDYCQVHRAIELIADETGKMGCRACAPYDWDDGALRARCRIGTVLESYDYAYIRVEEITPDGVVSRGLISRRQSWSWSALKRGEFRIYSQPGDEPVQPGATFPVIGQRGGRIPSGLREEARLLDEAIATEVLSYVPQAWDRVCVDAELGGGVTISGPKGETIEPTDALFDCLARLLEYTSDCQEIPGFRLAFTLDRWPDGWRYNVRFDYPGDEAEAGLAINLANPAPPICGDGSQPDPKAAEIVTPPRWPGPGTAPLGLVTEVSCPGQTGGG